MFVVAAGVILLCAEAFAESIIELGEAIGVSEFLLVKWIAPTASEAPELLVATLFAWRLASRTGLGALISSKVNQWTLLVGTLPIVFSIFAGVLHGSAARDTVSGSSSSSPRHNRSSPSPSSPAGR